MSSLKSFLGRGFATSLYYVFRIFPIKKNKIYVMNFYGKGYGDSPKYIIDCILNKTNKFDIVWGVKDNYSLPIGVRTVYLEGIKGLIKSIYEQTTAKVWIDNSHKYSYERKRKGQYYIQTWHGDIGVKKIGGDCLEKIHPDELLNYYADARMVDLFVCGNEWFRYHCKDRLFYNGEVATCGLPRRDILYTEDDSVKTRIKAQLRIENNVRLLLFVPTFRDKDFKGKLGNYASDLDWGMTLNALTERFGGEWYGLMRLHPHASKYSNDLVLPPNVINVTNYPDISELMCISDVCISDYSSAIFDFAVTKKFGFIFAPDKGDYIDERGYLFKDEDLPFTVSNNINELIINIKLFDEDNYLKRHHSFYNEIIHLTENGHASEFLAQRITDVCKIY